MAHPNISALSFEQLISKEWLLTNGVGGYASSTACGLNTRKYHGLLVAAMTPPVRRMVLLAHVDEQVIVDGHGFPLSCNEYPGAIFPQGQANLRAFSTECFPRWAYQADGFTLEKSVRLLNGENTVCLAYTLLGGNHGVDLELRPQFALRPIHELMFQWNARIAAESRSWQHHRLPPTSRTPEVFFAHDGQFRSEGFWYLNTIYRRETERGYAGLEDLWMPGTVRWTLTPGQTVHFVCSSEPIELARTLELISRQYAAAAPAPADANLAALLRAADAFIVTAVQDPAPQKPVHVVTHYPWSPPSCRGGLIAFTGLFLIPGKFDQARRYLQQLASMLDDGLIPTEFSEEGGRPLYSGADTSLWFINAVHEYLRYSGDDDAAPRLLPAIDAIIAAYRGGAPLGIVSDADHLLASRAAGTPTSWMDAKAGDWVVTPRSGRTVELNALWYNGLKIAATLHERAGNSEQAQELSALAQSVQESFNRRFWNEKLQCCFDVVEDDSIDASIRPNQLLAVSLPHAVLAVERQETVVRRVVDELLTLHGVRTLSPNDPAYKGHYAGGVIARDRAQHQGSAFPWLLGALVDAFLRVNGRNDKAVAHARQFLAGVLGHLDGDGLGQIPELFDGSGDYHPGGAIASALSVGEVLRCYAQDILGQQPNHRQTNGPTVTPPASPVTSK